MNPNEERFREHCRSREIKPPPVLYKYCKLEDAMKIARSGRVLCKSPLLFNDPFDCQWDPAWPVMTPEACEQELALFNRVLADPSMLSSDASDDMRSTIQMEHDSRRKMSSENREAKINRDREELRGQSSEQASEWRQMYSDQIRRTRAFCLAKDPLSILMWSHYGDQHRGVAIGFATDVLERAWVIPAEPIKYSDTLPVVIDADAFRANNILGANRPVDIGSPRETALSKHSGWKYEQEWRFVSIAEKGTPGDQEFFRLPCNSVARLVFGCRADRVLSMELRSLLGPPSESGSVVKLKCHPTRFELVEEPFESPVTPSSP